MTEETNIPAFALAMATIPKRLRHGLAAAQHGRDNAMLIESVEDHTRFVGRLTKKGKKRYSFEAFDAAYTQDEVPELAKVIAEGRTSSPLRGMGLARQFHSAHLERMKKPVHQAA